MNAGAAAVVEEIEKDQKHEAHVEHAGGRFYPLVMETLGVWTPSSLLTLRTIAARTTIRNGLTVRQATLLFCLAITLGRIPSITVLFLFVFVLFCVRIIVLFCVIIIVVYLYYLYRIICIKILL